MLKHTLAAVGLSMLLLACCFGGSGGGGSTVTRLDPYALELEHMYTAGAAASGSYLFTSGDGSSTVTISAAAPGAAAALRDPHEIAAGQVQWSRPRSYGGLSGMEARLTDGFQGQVHWVGAVDAPGGGVVWMHLQTSTQWIDTPTRGDPGWETLANGLRPAR